MTIRARRTGKPSLFRIMVASVIGVSAIFVGSIPGGTAGEQLLALWEMNESSDDTTGVLVDSSGNEFTGTIGNEVIRGVAIDGAVAHRFTPVSPNLPPANPNRIDQIPHRDQLNPGASDFVVTIRYRTRRNFGNLIQKGQAGYAAAGGSGYWKIEQPYGYAKCLFRGTNLDVNARSPIRLNDGLWHTVRCALTATSLTMTVDGTYFAHRSVVPHDIANSRPMTIGGKVNCDQIHITCDYFVGDIDYVMIEKGL